MRAVLQGLDTEPDPSYVPTISRRVSALARMIIGPPDAPRRREADVPEGSTDFDAEAWKQSWPGCRIDASAFVEKVSGSGSVALTRWTLG